MTSLRLMLFSLAMLAGAGASVVTVWQTFAARALKSAQALVAARSAEVGRQLRVAAPAGAGALLSAPLDGRLVSRSEAPSAGSEAAVSFGTSGAPPEGIVISTGTSFVHHAVSVMSSEAVVSLPEDRETRLGSIEAKYGGFLPRLGLSPAQEGRLREILLLRDERASDLRRAAETQGLLPSDLDLAAMHEENRQRQENALRALLGEARLAQLQNFERSIPGQHVIGSLIHDAALLGVAFEHSQLVQLSIAVQGTRDLPDPDWEQLREAAHSILTAEQMAFLQPRLRHQAARQKSQELLSRAETSLSTSAASSSR
jgi:hypothetical protein